MADLAPDGRLIVRDLKKKKIDPDDYSSDEEIGLPESIRMSDQKVAQQQAADEYSRGKKSKTSQVASNANDGSSFRAKKAGGDVKKHGQHDPYSYLPLRKDMLNKR